MLAWFSAIVSSSHFVWLLLQQDASVLLQNLSPACCLHALVDLDDGLGGLWLLHLAWLRYLGPERLVDDLLLLIQMLHHHVKMFVHVTSQLFQLPHLLLVLQLKQLVSQVTFFDGLELSASWLDGRLRQLVALSLAFTLVVALVNL